MKRRRWFRMLSGRMLLFGFCAGITSLFLLLHSLIFLAPRLSPTEKATLASSGDWHRILTNPLFWPLKALQWLTVHIPGGQSVWFSRFPSVLVALLALVLLCYILYRWYGPRSMVFGFIIFICSAWFLHIARFAGTDVMFVTGMLALLAIHVGLYDLEETPAMFFIWLLINLVLLSIPGFIWFVLLSMVWQWRGIVAAWSHLRQTWQRLVWGGIALIGLALPIVSMLRGPVTWQSWFGLPTRLSPWRSILNGLWTTLQMLFFRGPNNPELWLGQLPYLDIFLLLMLAAGIVFYGLHWRASRSRVLLSYAALGTLLAGLSGGVSLVVIMPIIYIVATGGIAYVLHFWFDRFPINPVARGAGLGLVSLVVLTSCAYNLVQYFVAWPHNPDVEAIYQKRPEN